MSSTRSVAADSVDIEEILCDAFDRDPTSREDAQTAEFSFDGILLTPSLAADAATESILSPVSDACPQVVGKDVTR